MTQLRSLLDHVANQVATYRENVGEARVFPDADLEATRAAFGGPLPEEPSPARQVVDALIAAAEPALVSTTGPRYFGFVVGGALDAATAADILATGWDQPAYNHLSSPSAALAEEAAGEWLKELLGLPAGASFGFVTGGQAANTVGLAAARHYVLAKAGWDVEQRGLAGGPAVRVVASEERHATIDRALRLLGLGAGSVRPVASDRNGAIDIGALRAALAEGAEAADGAHGADGGDGAERAEGPTIVCLQAGNVNSGACDDLVAGITAAHEHGAWVHVDGAFGLWAAASPARRHLVEGLERADSWACDGHKWLNVPYDSGYVFCAHPEAHVAAMTFTAAYLVGTSPPPMRVPADFAPESSRRARGFATWAALRQLGRRGVADLVERTCALALQFAERLKEMEGVEVVNDVVLNQVLVRFGGDDSTTQRVIDALQRGGECWMGATTWHGQRLMRISVSNWSTTEADVERSVKAIAAALG
ncbi:MAG TPA: pyridoxal-dependent decarboxylase [Acidimicrobiales bacterium]|nr:pyridoxal-dependent decarboxylase [Acidimicrobiales bacterium]